MCRSLPNRQGVRWASRAEETWLRSGVLEQQGALYEQGEHRPHGEQGWVGEGRGRTRRDGKSPGLPESATFGLYAVRRAQSGWHPANAGWMESQKTSQGAGAPAWGSRGGSQKWVLGEESQDQIPAQLSTLRDQIWRQPSRTWGAGGAGLQGGTGSDGVTLRARAEQNTGGREAGCLLAPRVALGKARTLSETQGPGL